MSSPILHPVFITPNTFSKGWSEYGTINAID